MNELPQMPQYPSKCASVGMKRGSAGRRFRRCEFRCVMVFALVESAVRSLRERANASRSPAGEFNFESCLRFGFRQANLP